MRVLLFGLIICLLASCDDQKILPDGVGRNGEVMVVMDQRNWEGEPGKAIRELLEEEQDGLPQSEPMFSLVRVSDQHFGDNFSRTRNIIITRSGVDTASATVSKNVWASDQVVIHLNGKDPASLASMIRGQQEMLRKTLYENDFRRMHSQFRELHDEARAKDLFTRHGFDLLIPETYQVVADSAGFVWFKHSFFKLEQGLNLEVIKSVWVTSEPYTGPEQLDVVSVINRRDSITHRFIKGGPPGSYQKVVAGYPHSHRVLEVKGNYAVEVRGLWNMENAFMGGPYVTLSVVDETRGRLYTIDGFVYAPNTEKRDYVREIEAIIHSVRFNQPE